MIKAKGGECMVVQADVTDIQDCERAVKGTVDRWGRLDILINNVGTSRIPGDPRSSTSRPGTRAGA